MATSSHARSDRIELRTTPDDKALLVRAAALAHLDLTSFVLGTVLPHAEKVIAEAERISLSPRDSLKVLELLENPPPPPARLIEAASARLPKE